MENTSKMANVSEDKALLSDSNIQEFTSLNEENIFTQLKDLINQISWQFFAMPLIVTEIDDVIPPQRADEDDKSYQARKKAYLNYLNEGQTMENDFVTIAHGSGKKIGKIKCEGDCQIQFPNTGKWKNIDTNDDDTVYDGAKIRTGKKSRARIEYEDGTVTIVGPRTVTQPKKNYQERVPENESFLDKWLNWWKKEESSEFKDIPTAVPADLGTNPDETKVAMLSLGGKKVDPSNLEKGGFTPKSALDIKRGEVFYEGVLSPGHKIYGKIKLKARESVSFKYYLRQFHQPGLNFQSMVTEVGDSDGGLIAVKAFYCNNGLHDLANIENYTFEAESDSEYLFCFTVRAGHPNPNVALKLKIIAQQ